MKKLLFLSMFFVLILILGGSCKKKEAPVALPPPPPPPPVEISAPQFILSLADNLAVINLKEGEEISLPVPKEVKSDFATVSVKKFKSEWTCKELLPISKKMPLTIVNGEPGSTLLVTNYFDLCNWYDTFGPNEKFIVENPKPMYSAILGDKEYWVGPSGKFWKTWSW